MADLKARIDTAAHCESWPSCGDKSPVILNTRHWLKVST